MLHSARLRKTLGQAPHRVPPCYPIQIMLAWGSFTRRQLRTVATPVLSMATTTTDEILTMIALTTPSHIAILGAGLMGRLLALELAREGHRVEVSEAKSPDADGAAARVAAAMLAPLAEIAITEPGVVRMGQYGLTRWPELIAQLDEHVFFQQNGTLVRRGTARTWPMPTACAACLRKTAASTPACQRCRAWAPKA